ncbi:MAG TPA: hypothetical protein VKB26_00735 [Candidatus Acidoferrales bacterium]|nr:hypothetical protein [Candidatus Acidoferrales bacterium]
MSLRSRISTLGLIGVILLFGSCQEYVNLPVPAISTLSPASIAADSTTFTLTVNGSGFAPSSQIEFDGSPRFFSNPPSSNTIFLSSNQLTTVVNPSDVLNAQTINVTVFSPAPGGGTSNTVTLVVTPTALPVPQITSLNPSTVGAGSGGENITILGTGFVGVAGFGGTSISVATVDGANRPTTFISSTQLSVTLQGSDVASTGPVEIAVLNPPAPSLNPPGGGVSNSMALTVVNPAPVLKAVSPPSVVAGTPSTTTTSISVSGSGFDSASEVLINGTGRPTIFNSSSSLSAQLATGDLAAAGTYTVQVENPSPGGGLTQVLHFSVVPAASGAGLPTLVDVAPDGAQANDGVSAPTQVGPSMDATGRFVAYASSSTNLLETTTIIPPPVPNPLTNGTSNIFLRDTCLGNTVNCAPREILVDLGPANVIANGPSFSPVVNSTGANIVAYVSLGTDLVSGFAFDGTTPQVFATNPCVNASSACTVTTNLISVGSDGMSPGLGASTEPSISGEGRFVAFASTANNLVSGATTGVQEVYLRDTCFGQPSTCTPTTFLVSAAPDGVTPADGASSEPVVVSGKTGQFVAFTSAATNLVSGASGASEIYRVGLCIGITKGCTATSAQLISTPDGTTFADGASIEPAMTADGRVVAFASTATNLGVPSGGVQEIYERDTCQGVPAGCTAQNKLVSSPDGSTPGNALSESPSIGNAGQDIAFSSQASNLVKENVNGIESVYVRNSCLNQPSTCLASTALVSLSALQTPGNGPSLNPVISSNGAIVAFYSAAGNLVNNDLNGFPDIFLAFSTF